MGVPQRLEQLVGRAQRQDVLNRLLAQVVVDPEHVVGGEDLVDQRVELAAGGEVVAERLLDDDPAPAAADRVVGHAGAPHLPEYQGKHRRRDGQVERRVAGDAMTVLEPDQLGGQRVEGLVVVEGAGLEPDGLRQPVPDVVTKRGPRPVHRRLAGQLLEVAMSPVAPGEPEQHELRRQQAAVGEVVHRRDQLLSGQVPGDAEHHEGARIGHPRQPPVARIAERVEAGVRGVDRHAQCSSPCSTQLGLNRLDQLDPRLLELLDALALEVSTTSS